jgi:hypothetical protein
MNSPVRHRIQNHAGEASIERYREPFSVIKEVPLLAMRGVSLCILAAVTRRLDAFDRLTGARMECP